MFSSQSTAEDFPEKILSKNLIGLTSPIILLLGIEKKMNETTN